ncbi:GNAT family N-acetyltransferase [Rubrimonas cliftonensis]|uniref:[SSU ribosomal protein S18P]-alanine acetyltransferase n=1 Tax=Rubrimonas cliftonensis TaxID=89524 RepID=A0A1H4DXL0_9RHOB|nr:GNAT family N-acetyltransferase [Rubrimonas cliftonensis]SEA77523.1 [SSU ribosomal protein S18P]-alanine acetyltransferase [Rubrimonas cliftonensis]
MTRRAAPAVVAAGPAEPRAFWSALSRLHWRAFAGRERRWSAGELDALAASPGVRVWSVRRGAAAPLGFVAMRVVGDEAEILTIAVARGARRRGLGRGLLLEAEYSARGAGASKIILEVAESAAPARALYARLGYGEVGRRRAYYAGPPVDDALVLARSFFPTKPV